MDYNARFYAPYMTKRNVNSNSDPAEYIDIPDEKKHPGLPGNTIIFNDADMSVGLLIHEMGHAFDFHAGQADYDDASYFSWSDQYNETVPGWEYDDRWDYTASGTPASSYGGRDPDEDFAETFTWDVINQMLEKNITVDTGLRVYERPDQNRIVSLQQAWNHLSPIKDRTRTQGAVGR